MSSKVALSVDIDCTVGDFRIVVAFEAAAGVTALFGPSGAGKTSVLNTIAGILTPTLGRIVAGDLALFDKAAGIAMAPQHRAVGYVFQDGRLFPHMSVS